MGKRPQSQSWGKQVNLEIYNSCGNSSTTLLEFPKAVLDAAKQYEIFALSNIVPITTSQFSPRLLANRRQLFYSAG